MKVVTALPDLRNRPTVSIVEAAQLLGIGRTMAYDLAKSEEFPVPVLRMRGLYRIPTAPLLAALGLSTTSLESTDDPLLVKEHAHGN